MCLLFHTVSPLFGGGAQTAVIRCDMATASLTFCVKNSLVRGTANSSLLSQARRGNREAFAEMVSPYAPAVYRRARGLTGNAADAEDVSQESLLKAWSRLGQFTGTRDESADDFRAWITRIAANASIDLLRQRRDGKMLSLEEPKGSSEETLGSGIATQAHDPEERCARREMGRLLANAIVQLPPDLRQACLLRDVLHYSTQEVADRLGVSIVAVRLRLFRAHRRLREKLQERLSPLQNRNRAPSRQIRAAETACARFAPLGASASYASGD
jgi:RNA polymerase sigma-70 factor, ECF subfamily